MMLFESNRHRAFAISAAACCVLLAASSKLIAGAEPDVPSIKVVPEPRSVDDQIKLAGDYLAGRGVAQDFKLAAYWYEKAAGAGDPLAELETGYFYESGVGVAKDPVRAAQWYQLAVSSGLVGAKVNLAMAYLWGTGLPKNEKLALKLLSEAAANGSGLAACYLGDFYAFGIGVPEDQAAAERWYRKGASLHDPKAEFDLAALLFDAKEHAHDPRAAAGLLRESAASGYVPAMHGLGLLLVRNPGLAKYPGEAMVLLNDAANAGDWRSSALLGVLARDGNGVPFDNGAAYYHFRVAALQGGDEARKLVEIDLRLLSAAMGSGRAQAIDSEAGNWYRQHHFVLEFVDKQGQNQARFPALALAAPAVGEHAPQLLASPLD
ncbi:MAG: tetratricopeptide repeat protein [Terracidiphilus sp.]|jgi:TPR repeat protein